MTRRNDDPLGTRALFAPPAADLATEEAAGGPGSRSGLGPGRRALFSQPDPVSPRTVEIECGHCRRRARLGLLPLGARLVPSLWLPGTRFSRYIRCPSCHGWHWCRLGWSTFRPR